MLRTGSLPIAFARFWVTFVPVKLVAPSVMLSTTYPFAKISPAANPGTMGVIVPILSMSVYVESSGE